VRLAGIEPTTPWFVGKMDVVFCRLMTSIQKLESL
jgi:hypothetical protein